MTHSERHVVNKSCNTEGKKVVFLSLIKTKIDDLVLSLYANTLYLFNEI